jgi:hypothetical protein
MQEAITAVEDDSVYRALISLKVCRRYMEEVRYFFQENRPAMQSHLDPAAAMIKDLTAIHISLHSIQATLMPSSILCPTLILTAAACVLQVVRRIKDSSPSFAH